MISKEAFKLIVVATSAATGKNQEELALEMGYGKNYISEMFSPTGKVSQKFVKAFQSHYKDYLENPKRSEKEDRSPADSQEKKESLKSGGRDDLTMQILFNFSETQKNNSAAIKELSEANNRITRNQETLLRIDEALLGKLSSADASQEKFSEISEMFSRIRAVLVTIGTGKRWSNEQEALKDLDSAFPLPGLGKP